MDSKTILINVRTIQIMTEKRKCIDYIRKDIILEPSWPFGIQCIQTCVAVNQGHSGEYLEIFMKLLVNYMYVHTDKLRVQNGSRTGL